MELKAFHRLAVDTANLYAKTYLASHSEKTDEEKTERMATHTKLGNIGVGMYFAANEARDVVIGNLKDDGFFSFTAGGIEFNNSIMEFKVSFKETVFPIDIAAWLYEVKKCIEVGKAFEKQIADFKAEPGKVSEVEVVKTVEPDDYQEVKTKAGILDKMLSRDLGISGATASF